MIAYKGFTADLTCLGFQYAVGETYTHDGPVGVCDSGFHACPNPLDVLMYYSPATSRYALVECSGRIDTGKDGKIACETITIVRELTIAELIRSSVATPLASATASRHVATIGDYDDYAHAATSADQAHAATTGNLAHATTAGGSAHAVTAGHYARAVTAGNCAHAVSSGEHAHATTAGDCARAVAAGRSAHALTAGPGSNAATSGDSAVSVAVGRMSAAKAAPGGFLVLAQYRGSQIVAIRTAQVGKRGIKPDTWYCLDSNGKFVETEVC